MTGEGPPPVTRMALFGLDPRIGRAANMFGKDVANFQLFRALAVHGGLRDVDVMIPVPAPAETVAANLVGDAPGAARIRTTTLLDQRAACAAGTVLRGSGKLDELAWLRRKAAGDTAYSLIGLIHTLGPPMVRHDLAMASIGPVQAWDALVCTSPAVRDVMARLFDEWEAYLLERFGGSACPRPQLPIIPLGTDGAALAADADRPQARAARREAMGLGADDILLLWVGRLSFFEKAFPQAMMRAAEEAAQATGARVHLAMVGWFPHPDMDEPRYRAAAACAPSVGFHIVDGNDRATVADMWAAADIFVSLVDNIQETFGLTPIEAMACGLPVVISDWDGYRYTVRDGEQGFLVPTLGGPAGGLLDALADEHAAGTRSYQQYVGIVAQHTAVHVGRAASAIAALIRAPDLRRRMGAAGRRRVAETFDWKVVAPLYTALATELAAIRGGVSPGRRGRNPLNGDPFRDFAGFASATLAADTRLRLRPGKGAADLARARPLELDQFAGNWRGSPEEAEQIVMLLARAPSATVAKIVATFPAARHRRIWLSLLWLAKTGIIEWLGED